MSHVEPPPLAPQPQRNTALVIVIVLAVTAIPMLLVCVGVLVALLLPAVQASREAARRMQCANNLKQIALAMHNYEAVYRSFPPAYTTDENARPLHSWRTLLLPYLEQAALYNTIDLSKPWDDPVNQLAASTTVPTYSCPSVPSGVQGTTVYQVIVDPRSIFSGPRSTPLNEIIDGTSQTLLVAEVPHSQAVPWMSPQDCDLPTFAKAAQGTHHHGRGANMALADGSITFVSETASAEDRRALVTKDGGEAVNP